ncbi:MAG: 50S ribosomal protein L11 methyltransferase [Geminicoccaceae bacterium]
MNIAATDGTVWRASFRHEGAEEPAVPESVEDETLSVATFEIEDEAGTLIGWQVDLLFGERPDAKALAKLFGAEVTVEEVPPEDWVKSASLRSPPVRAGRFWVHGSHVEELPPPGSVAIQIDAGLAFGSGDHATTRLCLQALDDLARTRRLRQVLDLGCGSAVLAIAAAKLWPCAIVAADNDPIAVRVAAENVSLNGVARQVTCTLSDGYRAGIIRRRRPFDLVLANILADPLIELAPRLRAHLAPGGTAILSGLLDRQAEAVAAAHHAVGLRLVGTGQEGPWMALVFRLPALRARRPAPVPTGRLAPAFCLG